MPAQIDYETLFDRKIAQSYYEAEPEPIGSYYDDERGLVIKTDVDGGPFKQDLIQFAPDAFAFTGAGSPAPVPQVGHHLQTLGDSDWLHFCLRLGSRGVESISDYAAIDQPSRSCMITRYPAHTQVERISATNDSWKIACLWLRPKAVLRFLETTSSRIPEQLSWLTNDIGGSPRHFSLPLNGRMFSAVNDVLTCEFAGGTRRAFVRSKYLEILAMIYQTAVDRSQTDRTVGMSLSPKDEEKIAMVADIVAQRLDTMEPLSDLARQLGVSRTKLTQGFRSIYGTSIEAYWQECRMRKANDLLSSEGLSVKEVAFLFGYAEVASFTRAFVRAFGISPNKVRNS